MVFLCCVAELPRVYATKKTSLFSIQESHDHMDWATCEGGPSGICFLDHRSHFETESTACIEGSSVSRNQIK